MSEITIHNYNVLIEQLITNYKSGYNYKKGYFINKFKNQKKNIESI